MWICQCVKASTSTRDGREEEERTSKSIAEIDLYFSTRFHVVICSVNQANIVWLSFALVLILSRCSSMFPFSAVVSRWLFAEHRSAGSIDISVGGWWWWEWKCFQFILQPNNAAKRRPQAKLRDESERIHVINILAPQYFVSPFAFIVNDNARTRQTIRLSIVSNITMNSPFPIWNSNHPLEPRSQSMIFTGNRRKCHAFSFQPVF